MRAFALAVPMLITVTSAALAQSVSPGSTLLAPLPSPEVPAGSKASDVLRAAQGALTAGRAREAEDALEMAETRMLDRSVDVGQTDNPSDNPTVGQISQARQALAAHDKAKCLQLIQLAIGSASAQGL